MARTRERESARGRTPPPPRMTGAGLAQMALFGGLVAVLGGFVGVFVATSGTDTNVERRMDTLGAALCATLTAPEPEWWSLDHGTYGEAKTLLREIHGALTLPKIDKASRTRRDTRDYNRQQRNKKRLDSVEEAVGSFGVGVLRGMQLSFLRGKYKNHGAGARISDPGTVNWFKKIAGGGVRVGTGTGSDAMGAGSFAARVYHREYMTSAGAHVGDAYVILSKAAIKAKRGAGVWLMLTPLLIAVGVGLMIFAANNASAGMKALARDLDMIGRGKLDLRVHAGGSGEIGYLQRMADRMAKNLQLIQTTGSSDLDEAVEKEVGLAGEIHESLRPAEAPRLPGYELETLFKGGREIGGDYFDYIELDENRIVLIIADCSESLRGVAAAMVMAMTRAYLKAAVDPDTGPQDWLKWVNRRLSRDLKSGMAVTALVVVLDQAKGEITAASAGHRPIVMWRKGKTALINPNGIALGLDVGPVFDKTIEEKRFSMAKNDRIVLYTDGAITAENAAGEAYGEERFVESLRRQGAMNSAAFVNFVAGRVDQFLDGEEQTDDITISTLKKMK